MTTLQIFGTLELGCIYGLVAIGVYLSFRVLQFSDLTVDGSFPLGAATAATCILYGIHPIWATLAALGLGSVIGWLTAFLSNALKILNLLAGILVMSALYSINLRVMGGKPNLSLNQERTIFSIFSDLGLQNLVVLGIALVLVGSLTFLLLKSEVGLALRATGGNPRMSRAYGVNTQRMICFGIAISNGIVGLAGALFAQLYGFADVSLGVGTIIIGLASLILGETLVSQSTPLKAILGCILGSIVYRFLIAFALNMGEVGLKSSDLNLVTAVLVILAMGLKRWIPSFGGLK